MKKALVVLLAFALVGGLAAQGTIDVAGNVVGQWGIDLDNTTTGFKYFTDTLNLVVRPQIPDGNVKRSGAEGDTMYGEVSLGGIRIESDTGNDRLDDWGSQLDVAWVGNNVLLRIDQLFAKIVLGDVTIHIKQDEDFGGGRPDIRLEGDNGGYGWNFTNAYGYVLYDGRYGATNASANGAWGWERVKNWDKFQTVAKAFSWAQGFGIGIDYNIPETAVIGLDINSAQDWTVVGGEENAYAADLFVDLKAVEGLTAVAGVAFGFGYDDATRNGAAAGVKLGYDVKIGETDKITPVVAFDASFIDDVQYSVSGGVVAAVAKSNITAFASYNDDEQLAATVAAKVGAVDGLNLRAAFEYRDVAAAATMGVHGELGYDIKINDKAKVVPTVDVSWDDNATDDGDLYAKFDLAFKGFLANTVFNIHWDSNDLMNDAAGADMLGQLYFGATLSF